MLVVRTSPLEPSIGQKYDLTARPVLRIEPNWAQLRDQYLRHKDDPRPTCALLLAGGAIHDDAIYEVGRMQAERARDHRPRLAVIMSSYPSLADAQHAFDTDLHPYFEKLGFDPVFIPAAIDALEGADDDHW